MMTVRLCLACVMFLFILPGCGSTLDGTDSGEGADSTQAGSRVSGADLAKQDYRVFLSGAVLDTLHGNASFGKIWQPANGREEYLIELRAGSDFTGGMFIPIGDTTLPGPGTYDLAVPPPGDSTRPQPAYRIYYRRGLIINLASVSGKLTFSSVQDTLIQGSFDTVMRGDVPVPGAGVQPGEVHAHGEFKARAGNVGFVVGVP